MDEHLRNESSLLKSKDVKVGRIDVSREKWFLELHPNLEGLPNWVMYVRGQPFYFYQSTFVSHIMNYVRRLVDPYHSIHSLSAFEEFINFTKKDISGRHLTRYKVIGLFSDSDDYDGAVSELKWLSLQSYWKQDTLFAICTKPAVVKEIYAKYGSRYISNPYDKNSIFLLIHKNRFERNDIISMFDLAKPKPLNHWLSTILTRPLEEMTYMNELTLTRKVPIVVAFVDPLDEVKTQPFLDRIEELGRKYLHRVVFVWVDYRDNVNLMKILGVEGVP